MKLSPSAIALVAFSVGANAFIPSPSRSVCCRHAVRPAATGRRLQSGLILQSTVEEEEDVAAIAAATAAAEDGPVVLPTESADAAQSPLEDGDDAEVEVESERPGMAENAKFQCEKSVEMWSEFQRDGFWSAQENLRELGNVGTRFAQMGPEALSHWLVSCLFSTTSVPGCLFTFTWSSHCYAWLLRTLVLISFVHSYM